MSDPLAFPRPGFYSPDGEASRDNEPEDGMTLRDYFAAKAMEGMMAFHGSYGTNNGPGDIADRAHQIADAMLAARERKGGA
jgi:hypothetical protein